MCALGSKGVTIVSRTTWQQILYKMHKPQKLKAKPLDFCLRGCILQKTVYALTHPILSHPVPPQLRNLLSQIQELQITISHSELPQIRSHPLRFFSIPQRQVPVSPIPAMLLPAHMISYASGFFLVRSFPHRQCKVPSHL